MKNINLLRSACEAWTSADSFRRRRERCKRYTYGDQWCDIVRDDSGLPVVEADYISRSGKKPLTNNMIRQLVKTVIGRYRTAAESDGVYDVRCPSQAYIAQNSLAELDCRLLEEFLISGCAIQRVCSESRPAGDHIWIDNVSPASFFVNAFRDPRGLDIEMVGMFHDLSLPETIARFSPDGLSSAGALASHFPLADPDLAFSAPSAVGVADPAASGFFAAPSQRCRVYEIWTLDYRVNKSDAGKPLSVTAPLSTLSFVWHCRWLAPDGYVLASYDSPFAHRSHPFVIRFYPLTDGEVHSFVEDVIDQQRAVNRLVVLLDNMLANSAKGVLLFPMKQKPPSVGWDQIAATWSKSNGIIPIVGNSVGDVPQQIITDTSSSGAHKLLDLQLKLFETVSGVTDAVAGRNISPSTGKALYESQIRNSFIALADLLGSFSSLRLEREQKIKAL